MAQLKNICRLMALAAVSALLPAVFLISTASCLAQGFGSAPPPVVPVLPTDVTNLPLIRGLPLGPPNMPDLNVTSAIRRIAESSFPSIDQSKDGGGGKNFGHGKNADNGFIFEPRAGSKFEQNEDGSLQLTSGKVFVSVRKPSRLAIIGTPHASISVAGDGDAIVSFEDGLLRVLNLSALGERVKVDIHEAAVSAKIIALPSAQAEPGAGAGADAEAGAGAGAKKDNSKLAPTSASKTQGIAMAIKVGHELLASDHPLKRPDLNPADGVARRRSALFENDCMCVSEFSLASVLTDCDFVSQLEKNPHGEKEHKVLSQLAKMAAVLNYVNGEGGFVGAGKQR